MATKWQELAGDGMREPSGDKILIWIKRLMDYSKQLCFRTGNVSNYGILSDNNLFDDYKEKTRDDKYVLPSVI